MKVFIKTCFKKETLPFVGCLLSRASVTADSLFTDDCHFQSRKLGQTRALKAAAAAEKKQRRRQLTKVGRKIQKDRQTDGDHGTFT